MKFPWRRLAIVAVGILVVGLAWRAAPVIQFFLREQTLIRHGNIVVKKITDYEAAHGHPPDGLHEIGIQEGPSPVDMEGPIFYQRQGQNF
jgi:hypothetical protein